jgi:hypothetical protein
MNSKWHSALPIALMLVFAVSRWPGLWPESWSSFSPAYALAFCAGLYFSSHLAWWLPLLTLLVSDVVINLFYYRTPAVSLYMLPNYFAYGCLILLGRLHSPKQSWLRLLCGGLLGATLFYLITNTNSWLQNPQYPKTLAGWIQALTTGIPGWPPTWTFFRNTLLSGGLFTGLFVGAMKLTEAAEETEEQEREAAEEPIEEAEPKAE